MKVKKEFLNTTITVRRGSQHVKVRPQDLDELDVYNLALKGIDVSYMFTEETKPVINYKGVPDKELIQVEDMTKEELKNAFPHVKGKTKKEILKNLGYGEA